MPGDAATRLGRRPSFHRHGVSIRHASCGGGDDRGVSSKGVTWTSEVRTAGPVGFHGGYECLRERLRDRCKYVYMIITYSKVGTILLVAS